MTKKEFQQKLTDLGYNLGAIDGLIGSKTLTAFERAMTDGPDTPLSPVDVQDAADLLSVGAAKIWAVYDVEASAAPFINGKPTILFEPHVFSRLTGNKFDKAYPHISSKKWNRKLYPGSQSGRWDQLKQALQLDVDAALSSASYGGFQILGSNYKVCGYDTPFDFVHSQSRNVRNQLIAFVNFVKGNKLDIALRKGDWAAFAKGYNGPAYRENKYDTKLAAAYAKRSK